MDLELPSEVKEEINRLVDKKKQELKERYEKMEVNKSYVLPSEMYDFFTCKRRIYLKMEFPEALRAKGKKTLLGSYVHDFINLTYQVEPILMPSLEAMISRAFQKLRLSDAILKAADLFFNYTDPLLKKIYLDLFPDLLKNDDFNSYTSMIRNFLNHRANDWLYTYLTYRTLDYDRLSRFVEYHSELKLKDENLRISGQIDAVHFLKRRIKIDSKEINKIYGVIWEYKTGKHHFAYYYQILLYYILLKDYYPAAELETAFLYYLKNDKILKIKLNPSPNKYKKTFTRVDTNKIIVNTSAALNRVRAAIKQILEIKEGYDPGDKYNPRFKRCQYCPFNEICRTL